MGVDWGSVPAWVGSILTGGSLLLGFSILVRDRRERRKGQANRVVVWGYEYTHVVFPRATGIRHSRIKLFVSNSSDQPIVGVIAVARDALAFHADSIEEWPPPELEQYPQTITPLVLAEDESEPWDGIDVLLPGQKQMRNFCFPDYPGPGRLYVMFMDARRQVWIRDVVTGSLRRAWRDRERYREWKGLYQRGSLVAMTEAVRDEIRRAQAGPGAGNSSFGGEPS